MYRQVILDFEAQVGQSKSDYLDVTATLLRILRSGLRDFTARVNMNFAIERY